MGYLALKERDRDQTTPLKAQISMPDTKYYYFFSTLLNYIDDASDGDQRELITEQK